MPECDLCLEELKEPGALLFSPPDVDSRVLKRHVCVKCYEEMIAAIFYR